MRDRDANTITDYKWSDGVGDAYYNIGGLNYAEVIFLTIGLFHVDVIFTSAGIDYITLIYYVNVI